jgi:hypothetical protein
MFSKRIQLSAVTCPCSPRTTANRSGSAPKPLKYLHTRIFCRNVRVMATPGCSKEACSAQCTDPSLTSGIFRALSCASHIVKILDAFETVFGLFCCVPVISVVRG